MAIYRVEADGVGAIGRDGKLVDAAHMRLAENVLYKASLVATRRLTPLATLGQRQNSVSGKRKAGARFRTRSSIRDPGET